LRIEGLFQFQAGEGDFSLLQSAHASSGVHSTLY